MTQPAPIYGATLQLAAMVLQTTETWDTRGGTQPLPKRLQEGALRLVDHVVLALGGFDRRQRLTAADAELQTLRAHLFLALQLDLMEEERFLALAEATHHVGRQLGGWIKKIQEKSP
ncbi:MAG: hypothetical protein HW380_1496 [Magnetococcales bacterium]|nr:hypothetical protein [Magnetococcales bacterium]HIJ84437.1 hypothetical protein [Magnetococcales bacterium]